MVILVAALSALPVLPAPISAPLSAPIAHSPAPRLQEESWDDIRAKISVKEMHPTSPAEEALADRIKTETLRALPPLSSISIDDLVELLAEATGIPMRITDEALSRVEDEGYVFSAQWTQPSSLTWCLDLIRRDLGRNLTWHVEGEEIVFSTPEERLTEQLFHLHPVKDLLAFMDIEDLATVVIDTCSPHLWDQQGCSIAPSGKFLAVTNYREVQLTIETLMNDTRAFYDSRSEIPRFELPAKLRAEVDEIRRLENLPVTSNLPQDEGTAVQWLAEFAAPAGLNFHITANIREELDLDDRVTVGPLEGIHQMPLGEALRSLSRSLDARATILPGWIILHTEGESFEPRAQLNFDVWDIVAPLSEPDEVIVEAAMLEEYIHNIVDPISWDLDPANSIRVTEDGVLVVSQSAEALDELCTMLQKLQKVAITTRGRLPRKQPAGR